MPQYTTKPGISNLSNTFRGVNRSAKGYIKNLVLEGNGRGEEATHTFFFRPNPINESLEVAYNKVAPLGMSHSYHVYQSTGNAQWSFELFQNRLMILRELGAQVNASKANEIAVRGGQPSDRAPAFERGYREGKKTDLTAISEMMEQSRRFLDALAYAPRLADGTAEAPPLCVLCIPGLVTATCVLVNKTAAYEAFDCDGYLVQWRAQVVFEEELAQQLTMDDVLARGSFRGPQRK